MRNQPTLIVRILSLDFCMRLKDDFIEGILPIDHLMVMEIPPSAIKGQSGTVLNTVCITSLGMYIRVASPVNSAGFKLKTITKEYVLPSQNSLAFSEDKGAIDLIEKVWRKACEMRWEVNPRSRSKIAVLKTPH